MSSLRFRTASTHDRIFQRVPDQHRSNWLESLRFDGIFRVRAEPGNRSENVGFCTLETASRSVSRVRMAVDAPFGAEATNTLRGRTRRFRFASREAERATPRETQTSTH